MRITDSIPDKKINSLSSKRLQFLDSIRGIAAFLVLIQHLSGIFLPIITKELSYSYISLGQMGVVAFFLVSGFIIPYSLERSNSIGDFFINRIFRIYPLYIFVILMQMGMTYMSIENGIKDIFIINIFLTHIIFIQEYIPFSSIWSENLVLGSWTLFIEAIWYILIVCLFRLKITHKQLMISSIVFFSTLILTSILLDIRFPFGKFGMLYNCIVGLHIYRWRIGAISAKQFWSILIPTLIIILIGLNCAYGYFTTSHFSAFSVIISWTGAYAIFAIFYLLRTNNNTCMKMLSFTGKISFSVYLTHFTVTTLLIHFFGNSPTFFLLSIGCTFIFSILTYYLIEKPGIFLGKWIISRKYRVVM